MMQRVYYEGEAEGDIHKFTAKEMGITRKLAKTINYALLYGATPKTLSVQARIKDLKKCSALLDKWFRTFRDAAEWIKAAQEEGIRDEWALPTLFGRRIKLPKEYDRWGKLDVEAMKRKAVNYPILGSDGEIMKRALLICAREKLPLKVTVHDSITLDGDCKFPVEELENIAPVRIPLVVKQTLRWE
jgi:DNA polymerase I-like protein with 3'-5' exonuclease and polymerase domains